MRSSMQFHTKCTKSTMCAAMASMEQAIDMFSHRACEFLGVDYKSQKIITCHIGNGASMAAIKDGKVIDTSMGLTPLEGLMMGSRSGDIDASAVTYMMEKLGKHHKKWQTILTKRAEYWVLLALVRICEKLRLPKLLAMNVQYLL